MTLRHAVPLFAVAAALSGCATTAPTGAALAANADPPTQCKYVTVDSGYQSLRMAGQTGVGGDAIDRSAGALEANRIYANPPRGLRAPPGSGLVHDLAGDC
jgi:hypothetical protein